MIDETNLAIGELEDSIRRSNDRRYAFYRMLNVTDKVLWGLEEMNRDGVKTVPRKLRSAIKQQMAELPAGCKNVYRDSDQVQEILDSVFEVQESLFRWRDPQRFSGEEEDFDRLVG
ncbi:hypothetical protein [Candidatus Dormiibacter inghamiae]